MELIAGIMLDVFFFARFTYIKTQFYKTKGVANGNDRRYISEFIYGYKGHNYVCRVNHTILRIIYMVCSFPITPLYGLSLLTRMV